MEEDGEGKKTADHLVLYTASAYSACCCFVFALHSFDYRHWRRCNAIAKSGRHTHHLSTHVLCHRPIQISSVYWKAIILGIDKSANVDWILHVTIFFRVSPSPFRPFIGVGGGSFSIQHAGISYVTFVTRTNSLPLRAGNAHRNNIFVRNFLFWMRNTTVYCRICSC